MAILDICQCEYIVFMAAKHSFNMERFFQALGDNTRLRLLNLMSDQEICVCYFVEILDQLQPKISRHLAYLRSARMVAARRDGKWMHYRMVMPGQPRYCDKRSTGSRRIKPCRRIVRCCRRHAVLRLNTLCSTVLLCPGRWTIPRARFAEEDHPVGCHNSIGFPSGSWIRAKRPFGYTFGSTSTGIPAALSCVAILSRSRTRKLTIHICLGSPK